VDVGAAGGELHPGYGAGPGGGGRRLLRSGNCSSDTLEEFLKDSLYEGRGYVYVTCLNLCTITVSLGRRAIIE
jgi:hypothetical protein